MSVTMKDPTIVKILPFTIKDDGKVRMGMVSPPFPPARVEPKNVSNGGLTNPIFPPVRSR